MATGHTPRLDKQSRQNLPVKWGTDKESVKKLHMDDSSRGLHKGIAGGTEHNTHVYSE